MKQKRIIAIILLCAIVLTSLCGCDRQKAMEKKTGARALRAILEKYMLDIMYEIPKDDSIGQVVITKEYIDGNGGPKIVLRGQPLIACE